MKAIRLTAQEDEVGFFSHLMSRYSYIRDCDGTSGKVCQGSFFTHGPYEDR